MNAQVLEHLHHCERRAGEHAFRHGRAIYEALVAVKSAAVEVAQPLNVLAQRDAVPQDIILRWSMEARLLAVDGVVHHDPMHVGVMVRRLQRRVQVTLLDLTELESEAIAHEGPLCPLRVLPGSGVIVGEKSDKLGRRVHACDGRLNLLLERLRDLARKHLARPWRAGASNFRSLGLGCCINLRSFANHLPRRLNRPLRGRRRSARVAPSASILEKPQPW
mmetsp:Transcript_60642/g.169459  ORF Transcript_60642/g.169459 Transcript_60642/m.169459 type:complete len:220 (+) Transcript_60642:2154-2813(+)